MAILVGSVNQKGGVGKSAAARGLAREFANADWRVKIADMDCKQGTSCEWGRVRMSLGIKPEIPVEHFTRVSKVLEQKNQYDLIIFDGAPHSSSDTLDIAKHSDLVLLPTGFGLDDLKPTIKLAHELKKAGINTDKIALIFMKGGDSEVEYAEVRDYVSTSGYNFLPGYIPQRTAYRRAADQGLALTETRFPSLNQKAADLIQEIGKKLTLLTNIGVTTND